MVALHGGACDSALVQLNMGCVVYLQRIGSLLSNVSGHAAGYPYSERENVGLYQNTARRRKRGGRQMRRRPYRAPLPERGGAALASAKDGGGGLVHVGYH